MGKNLEKNIKIIHRLCITFETTKCTIFETILSNSRQSHEHYALGPNKKGKINFLEAIHPFFFFLKNLLLECVVYAERVEIAKK